MLFVALAVLAAPGPAQGASAGANGKIAFTSTETPYSIDADVFTVNPDGSAFTRLTDEPAGSFEPHWSPDGTKIAFVIYDPYNITSTIWIMSPDGTGRTKVVDGASGPTWSPDGRKLAFTRSPYCAKGAYECPESDLYTVNVDGTGLTRLTNENGIDELHPAWSPDGSKIAFTGSTEGSLFDVWTLAVSDGALTRLTDDPGNDLDPAWSPDGARIAFWTGRDEPSPFQCGSSCNTEIYSMRPDGGDLRRVTVDPKRDEQPAWSPDGTQIAFARIDCGVPGCGLQIETVGIDGSGMTPVTSGANKSYDPDWQPLPGPRREDYKNSAKFCKAQRDFLGEATFRQRYGGGASAYGKCVSGNA